jgi:hypothetical protein
MRRAAFRTPLLLVLLLVGLGTLPGPASAAEEFEKYELESVSASLSTTQAGAHADFTTAFELSEKEGKPYAQTRDIAVQLPPGMIGNPQGIPRCTVDQLGVAPKDSECPIASQIGISEVTVGGALSGTFREAVYNMVPPASGDRPLPGPDQRPHRPDRLQHHRGGRRSAFGRWSDQSGDDPLGSTGGPQP